MASVLASIEELILYGWIRANISHKFRMYIPEQIQHLCLLFYGVIYQFNEDTMNNRWKIKPFTNDTKARIRERGWRNSNIFFRPLLRVGAGEYELRIQFFSKHNRMFDNFVIGICSSRIPLLGEMETNYCNVGGMKSYSMCASGAIIPSVHKSRYARKSHKGSEIRNGDTIHVFVNMDVMKLRFGINGRKLGTAFSHIPKDQYVFAFASYFPCDIDIV